MNSLKILQNEFKNTIKNNTPGFSIGLHEDNLYIWDVSLIGPSETIFENGIYQCKITFPKEYPMKPPMFTFISKIFHPNIYTNGNVCISILHPPGDDEYGYEDASERWRPVHTTRTIILSIISMLNEPNLDSPANIEAAKLYKENRSEYNKINKRYIED